MTSAQPEATRRRVAKAVTNGATSPAAHIMRALATGQQVRSADGAALNRSRALVSIVIKDMRKAGWTIEGTGAPRGKGGGQTFRATADYEGHPIYPAATTWRDELPPEGFPPSRGQSPSNGKTTPTPPERDKQRVRRKYVRREARPVVDTFTRPVAASVPPLGEVVRVTGAMEDADGVVIALHARNGGAWFARIVSEP